VVQHSQKAKNAVVTQYSRKAKYAVVIQYSRKAKYAVVTQHSRKAKNAVATRCSRKVKGAVTRRCIIQIKYAAAMEHTIIKMEHLVVAKVVVIARLPLVGIAEEIRFVVVTVVHMEIVVAMAVHTHLQHKYAATIIYTTKSRDLIVAEMTIVLQHIVMVSTT